MKAVVVTEGISEYRSLPLLYPQIQRVCRRMRVVRTLKINVSPNAPAPAIAKECRTAIQVACALSANLVLVLMDREGSDSCPGQISSVLRNAIENESSGTGIRVEVVLKDQMFENWLVADLNALRQQPKRFAVSAAMERAVSPNKADRCDALNLLKQAAQGASYSKTEDSARICGRMSIEGAAKNSRSFRHFLHVLGHPGYAKSCRTVGT